MSSAAATASRSARSTACQSRCRDGSGAVPPGRDQATTGARSASRSSMWPPTKPVAPVTRITPVMRASGARARAVLARVVRAEGGVLLLDRPPPGLVFSIPAHRRGEARVEWHLWPPPQRFELARVEGVPPIVALSIGHRLNERRRPTDLLQDLVREVDVRDLVAAADVVRLARHAALDQ